eukprot:CAMPEP_0119337830 /NCGR_PEP_ID=MMETSP1333-20130426/94806_1 /TAXON_ID=418940 /ORGANISM="Scyphosphaera apsteinii, Strain RCC1455" /LENGTH=466 /DNA_ID=CAMNT_0007348969 /DNA_START=82 /DNA_END=1482 /DNA_ORIENTATION=-
MKRRAQDSAPSDEPESGLGVALAEAMTNLDNMDKQVQKENTIVEGLLAALKQAKERLSKAQEKFTAAAAMVDSLKKRVSEGGSTTALVVTGVEVENVEEEDYPCSICMDRDDAGSMLLCDLCDEAFHIYCLEPPLDEIPEGQWFCKMCARARRDLLNKRVQVYWKEERRWFAGYVRELSYENKKRISHVIYDAGDDFWHDLDNIENTWKFEVAAVGRPTGGGKAQIKNKQPRAADLAPQTSATTSAASAAPTFKRAASTSEESLGAPKSKEEHTALAIRLLTDVLVGETDVDVEIIKQTSSEKWNAEGLKQAICLDSSDDECIAAIADNAAADTCATVTAIPTERGALQRLCKAKAIGIEQALRARVGENMKEYNRRCRMLRFNLRKNGDLRNRVLLGDFPLAELAAANHNDLATVDMQLSRRRAQERANSWVTLPEETERMISIPGLGTVAVSSLPATTDRQGNR